MSEVSRTLKRLQVINEELRCGSVAPSELATLHNEIYVTLLPAIDKAAIRLSQVDPVTGKPLYGAAMSEKVTQAKTLLQEILERHEERLSSAVKEEEENSKKQHNQASMPAVLVAVDTFSTHHSLSSDRNSDSNTQQQEQDEHLRAQATALREQRIDFQRQRRAAAETLRQQRLEFVSQLNSEVKSLPEALQSLADNNTSPSCLTALKCITALLQRIIQHPDNIQLRKLRVGNEKLFSDITSLSGGVELFVSVGFRAELLLFPPQDMPHRPEVVAQNEGTAAHFDDEAVLSSASQSLLHQVSSYCYLVMDEPDISSAEGMLEWSKWFDSLKAAEQVISEFTVNISSKT